MTIDDPASVVTESAPLVRRPPETLRQGLRSTRQVLVGIELTLVALLIAAFFGTGGLGGMVAAVVGGLGLIAVLTATD